MEATTILTLEEAIQINLNISLDQTKTKLEELKYAQGWINRAPLAWHSFTYTPVVCLLRYGFSNEEEDMRQNWYGKKHVRSTCHLYQIYTESDCGLAKLIPFCRMSKAVDGFVWTQMNANPELQDNGVLFYRFPVTNPVAGETPENGLICYRAFHSITKRFSFVIPEQQAQDKTMTGLGTTKSLDVQREIGRRIFGPKYAKSFYDISMTKFVVAFKDLLNRQFALDMKNTIRENPRCTSSLILIKLIEKTGSFTFNYNTLTKACARLKDKREIFVWRFTNCKPPYSISLMTALYIHRDNETKNMNSINETTCEEYFERIKHQKISYYHGRLELAYKHCNERYAQYIAPMLSPWSMSDELIDRNLSDVTTFPRLILYLLFLAPYAYPTTLNASKLLGGEEKKTLDKIIELKEDQIQSIIREIAQATETKPESWDEVLKFIEEISEYFDDFSFQPFLFNSNGLFDLTELNTGESQGDNCLVKITREKKESSLFKLAATFFAREEGGKTTFGATLHSDPWQETGRLIKEMGVKQKQEDDKAFYIFTRRCDVPDFAKGSP